MNDNEKTLNTTPLRLAHSVFQQHINLVSRAGENEEEEATIKKMRAALGDIIYSLYLDLLKTAGDKDEMQALADGCQERWEAVQASEGADKTQ